MEGISLSHSFFLIFTGAAIATTFALYTRQPFLVMYILLGALLGPFGMGYIQNVELLSQAADIGIIFLLFLLGLDLQPKALIATLKESSITALLSSLTFAALGFGVGKFFGFNSNECFVIGAALMFSSTIIGIKLLPTTVLHHKHTGDLMVGLLIMQDVLAILVLVFLIGGSQGSLDVKKLALTFISLPLLGLFASVFVSQVLSRLIARYDQFHEYIFLLSIGWCLCLSQIAHSLGLSSEIGALIAGVSLATSPISQYISISLKPLRDFFLVLFFFSVGAKFDVSLLSSVLAPTLIIAVIALAIKPVVFRFLLAKQSETNDLAWDIGFRLGQMSEFSLLIAYLAQQLHWIGTSASLLIQASAILSFLISTYIVIFNYPSPLAVSDALRRD
jgi:Kef-type K+ transport system membrane component KefB